MSKDIDFSEHVEDKEVSKEKLASITKLAKKQVKLQKDIKKAGEKLTEMNQELTQLAEVDIPSLMNEVGLALLRLKSGDEIEIKTETYASIAEKNWPKVMAWLKKNNFDGIVKDEIKIVLGKGMSKEAEKIMAVLEKATKKMSVDPQEKKSIHAGTLKAFVKERIKEGKKFPRVIFGVHEKDIAKIKLKKK
jgi:hypothetical protein